MRLRRTCLSALEIALDNGFVLQLLDATINLNLIGTLWKHF